MASELVITGLETTEGPVVIRAQGHLDAKSTPLLMQKCLTVKAQGKSLVLNLSEITFIASSGIGGLLALVEEFAESHLGIRLAKLSPAVESVIKLLNLDAFLDIDSTEDASLEVLKK